MRFPRCYLKHLVGCPLKVSATKHNGGLDWIRVLELRWHYLVVAEAETFVGSGRNVFEFLMFAMLRETVVKPQKTVKNALQNMTRS